MGFTKMVTEQYWILYCSNEQPMSIKKTNTTLLVIGLMFYCWGVTAQQVLTNPSSCGLGLSIIDESCPENRPFFSPNVFEIQVSNAPGNRLGANVYLKEIQLIILHEWAGDLDIKLISPGDIEVELTSDNGGDKNDYGALNLPDCPDYVILSYNACQPIINAEAPFLNGPYQPEEGLFNFNDGQTNPNGVWQLQICDDVETDIGTLEFVNLVFESIECLPVSLPMISTMDTTSLVLEWNHPEGVDCGTTIVEYGPTGFTPGNGAGGNQIFTTANCPPITLTGLAPETTYDIYLRKQCGGNNFSENSCPITLTTGCQPPPITLTEPFENTAPCTPNCGEACEINGNWRNASNDDFDWITNSGSSATIGTGPNLGVGGAGNYIYLETSGADCTNGKSAYLISNCMEIDKQGTDSCHFSFNYHMFGGDIGSLTLEVTIDGGFTWNNLWTRTGNQGDQWHKAYLSFAPLPDGAIAQFRFIGTGGNGPKGDIALDNITFYGSRSLGPPTNQYFADEDADNYGNPNVFILSCESEPPAGFVRLSGDCDDSSPSINPDQSEIPCDNLDNNCNGLTDDLILPSPIVSNDSICSGGRGEVCAIAAFDRPIFWYSSADGNEILAFGACYSPELPENTSPFPITFSYYASESDFTCSSSDRTEATITVFPKPELVFDGEVNVCGGQRIDLNSLNLEEKNFTGAAITFHSGLPATPDNQISTTLVSPSQTTTYFATASIGGECSSIIPIMINVSDGPEVNFNPSDNFTICKESSLSLSTNINGGSGDYTYQWSTGSTALKSILKPTLPPVQ